MKLATNIYQKPYDGFLVDVDFGLCLYIRCSGEHMNIHVYGRELQRHAHRRRPLA